MNEDSVVWLRVTCNPESAGFYKDKRSIYYVTKDFNGDPRTDSIVVTVTSNAKTTTPKKYWESTTFIEANIDEIATEKKGPVFVLTDKGRSLFRSYDGMRDWQQLSFPSMYIHSITRESGVLFCIDSANRLLRSSDDGTTWENIGDSLYFFVYCNQSAKAFGSPRVILSDHKGGVYVLITARWGCYAEDNYNQSIHFSKDSGRTWKSILNYSHSGRITDPVDSAFFAHSFYLTQSGDPVLIGSRYKLVLMDSLGVLNIVDTVGKVFTSNDTGKSIQNTTLLFDDAKGIISPFNSTIFLIAQRDGIYSTTDHGKNWYGINDDINTKYFTTIFCAPGMPIYLGTAASGLWRSIITTPELATKISKPTFKDALHCYPNPATSSVTIVTGDSPVRDIQLFNQLGREVPGFKSKVIEEGFTSQTIDVRNLPVGCYYFVVSYKNDNKSYVKLLIGM
jgi:hypothetical protein